MFRTYGFLAAAVLSCAAIFATDSTAHGQRWGYGMGRYNQGYYNQGYYYGQPGYYYNQGYYYPPTYRSYYYAEPAQYAQPAQYTEQTANSARMQVIVPDPNAQVMFEGQKTQQTGTNRLFESPPLTAGKTYNYTIKATWMQNGQEKSEERTISVSPGSNVMVDFNKPAQ
jgi:uncharacterized protein (TIGR03000 family)